MRNLSKHTNHSLHVVSNTIYTSVNQQFVRLVLLVVLLVFKSQMYGQLVTCTPTFPTEADSVTITFNAALGNKGLKGYTGDIYAHTGVITNESTGNGDWKHAPSWGDNGAKYKLTRIGSDLYQMKLKPSIRDYYGATASELIKSMAFVFRSGDKTKEGKTEAGADIFYSVYEAGLHLYVAKPLQKPVIALIGEVIAIEANSNISDSLQITIGGKTIARSTSRSITASITVENNGKTWVKVTAFKGIESIADSFYYFVKNMTHVEPLPAGVTDGVNSINDSTVISVLVAPNKGAAFLIGECNDWQLDTTFQMKQTPDKSRFWIQLTGLKPGTEYTYQFIVDGLKIADPYATKILDPWNDKFISDVTYPNLKKYPDTKTNGIVSIMNTKPDRYVWKSNNFSSPQKQNLIVYELLVRDFSLAHSYKAIIDSLTYLQKLGINAIELMPVMEFEGNESWGYNPSFYFAPDKYYGTENALKHFVDTCHALGIAVVFDIVLNHSFGQSPMVQLYWDAANNRPSADNPWFNPVPKHDYNVGYDFNHESMYTKQFVSQVLKYWLTEFKADGFRFDLSKGFTQKNTLGNVAAWGQYDQNRINTLKAIADTIWSVNQQGYVILEHFADNTEEKELASYGLMLWANANSAFREAAMGWNESGKSDFSSASYKTRGMDTPSLLSYMESHDEERLTYSNLQWGNSGNPFYPIQGNLELALKRDEIAAVFFLTIPGPKLIWQFGELGYDYSIDFNGRTGNKPVVWDYANDPLRRRLYNVYASMLKLKKTIPALSATEFKISVNAATKTISIDQPNADIRLLGNFGIVDENAQVSFSKTGYWYDVFSGDSIDITNLNQKILLKPSQYKFLSSVKIQSLILPTAPEALNPKVSNVGSDPYSLSVSYKYFDVNNDLEGNTQFQWFTSSSLIGSDVTKIANQNKQTCSVTPSDTSKYIVCQITPMALTGGILKGTPQYVVYKIVDNIVGVTHSSISVFPNPFTSTLYINVPTNDRHRFDIFSITGKLEQTGFTSQGKPINTERISSGIHILKIVLNNENIFYKIVK